MTTVDPTGKGPSPEPARTSARTPGPPDPAPRALSAPDPAPRALSAPDPAPRAPDAPGTPIPHATDAATRKSAPGRRRGRWARRACVALGPLYIKVGQILATRSDWLPPGAVDELRTLQDRGRAMGPAGVTRALRRHYGRPLTDVFASFDPVPVASASIAQVHRATLPDGTRVAVKVVKRGVPTALRTHLALLTALVRAAHTLLPPLRPLRMPSRVAEVTRLLGDQLSMTTELANMTTVAANFENHPFVTVPRAFPELSGERVLVMEYAEGIPGGDFHRVDLDRAELARRLQDILLTMLYLDGVVHGDLHPGNVLLSPDGRFTLLDFGITASYTPAETWGLVSFNRAATQHEWDLAVRRFTDHFVLADGDPMASPGYADQLRAVFVHHFHTVSDRWSGAAFFQDVNQVLRRHGAAYTTAYTKGELAMLSCEGYMAQIDPTMDIWANTRRFADRYSPALRGPLKERFDRHFAATTPTSLALRDRARAHLIAPTHLDRYASPSPYPLFIAGASGSRLTDVDGNEYIDLGGGGGPALLGRGHPVVREALIRAAATSNLNVIGHEAEVELAELLVDAFPAAERAILANSGTEASLHAIRLCRAHRPRSRLIAKHEGHFHGFADPVSVSSWFRVAGPPHAPEPIAGSPGTSGAVVRDTLVLQAGDPHSLDRLRGHAADIAGVLIEPMTITAEGADPGYLRALRGLCTELGIPLVFDEVVTGFRVAYGGIQTRTGIAPDLTVLGKAIGGGLPCGAVVGTAELTEYGRGSGDPFRDAEERAFLGGTMSGNHVTCVTGLAALRQLRDHPALYTELDRRTDLLARGLRQAADAHGVPLVLRAYHSIFALAFTHRRLRTFRDRLHGLDYRATAALAYWMRTQGVYLPELHAFLLSTAHTDTDVEQVVTAFDRSLGEMREAGLFTR
ncbi:aminotransferase class III-fold pyridoxal phosphate-dependent enzyme [Streptomyces sp. NPDC057638]|uniref:aminotransferase class III-fold pyridoxal phosphate-dependent enzyme n=1 Tax=Streptomyces sp. NPDC057638 TaxID=3346190 RepID=UPI0036846D0D